jgi:hypothetical protein
MMDVRQTINEPFRVNCLRQQNSCESPAGDLDVTQAKFRNSFSLQVDLQDSNLFKQNESAGRKLSCRWRK